MSLSQATDRFSRVPVIRVRLLGRGLVVSARLRLASSAELSLGQYYIA